MNATVPYLAAPASFMRGQRRQNSPRPDSPPWGGRICPYPPLGSQVGLEAHTDSLLWRVELSEVFGSGEVFLPYLRDDGNEYIVGHVRPDETSCAKSADEIILVARFAHEPAEPRWSNRHTRSPL